MLTFLNKATVDLVLLAALEQLSTKLLHCKKKYLVKMKVTVISGLVEQVVEGVPKDNHNFIKLQRASTDTCQQVNLYKFIAVQLPADGCI